MAHIAPSDLPNRALEGAHGSELETLARLKRELPSDYTVFHSVLWTNAWKAGVSFGEADFVIVNRAGALIIVEQKNGALLETEDGLVKAYGDSQKHVGHQITRTIDGLRRKFSWQHGAQTGLEIDYLIYCPDHHIRSLNASGIDFSRIVDGARAKDLAGIIQGLLPADRETEHGRRVHGFFEQTLCLVPDVHAHVVANEKAWVRLSGGLADTIDCIEMSPLRLRICGVPGSGKSSVAARAFERALRDGKRPLLVCFNRPPGGTPQGASRGKWGTDRDMVRPSREVPRGPGPQTGLQQGHAPRVLASTPGPSAWRNHT